MARLVSMAKIKLGQIINQNELFNLINFCLASKIPWAPHALACLLQDILENEQETESNTPSTSWATNGERFFDSLYVILLKDFLSEVANLCEFTDDEGFVQEPDGFIQEAGTFIPGITSLPMPMPTTTAEPLMNSSSSSLGQLPSMNQLPSVYESDDSDLEELVEGIHGFLDKSAPSTKKSIKTSTCTHTINSTALDSRLDLSVEAPAEIALRKLINKNTQVLLQNVNTSVLVEEGNTPPAPWPSLILPFQPESFSSSKVMLTQCFDSLFANLQLQDSYSIEHILQLWLTLNCPYKEEKFDPSATPKIILKDEAVKSLISAVAWAPGLSLITWCVALQTLTLVCNTNNNNGGESSLYWSDLHGMASCIVNHPDFVQVFLRLLSGSGITFINKVLVSETVKKILFVIE